MSRLYDRIMAYGTSIKGSPETAEWSRERLEEAVVVSIENVAQYWAEHKDATVMTPTDFPSVAPAFHTAFYETRWPKRDWTGTDYEAIQQNGLLPYAIGVGAYALENKDEKNQAFIAEYLEGHMEPDMVRWIVFLLLYWEITKGNIVGPVSATALMLDEYGAFIRSTDGQYRVAHVELDDDIEEGELDIFGFISILHPTLLAMSLTHCKNVALEDNEPARKLNRKHYKRHGLPLTTYKTLQIEPMKQTLNGQGGARTFGLSKALHICRGHFATYSPDKPLFGKYAGTFWKPQHVKGNKASGEIVKDYAVKAPK